MDNSPESFQKKSIRAHLRKKRALLSNDDVEKASTSILNSLIDLGFWKEANRAHIYKSQEQLREVDTTKLVEQLKTKFPRLSIEQPKASTGATMSNQAIDIVVIPILGFDRGGFRLGLGGGWYDRFLTKHPKALKVGLAYGWSEVEAVPTETHDIPMDIIATPTIIIHFKHKLNT